MNDIQSIIPIVGYIDATTPDLSVHSPILEGWARTVPALFQMGVNEHVCTQAEMKQHVAQNLLALRQDLEQELDAGDEFYTMLCDLALRLELDPAQQAVVCDAQPHVWLNLPDTLVILVADNDGNGLEIRQVSDLAPDERAQFELYWRQFVIRRRMRSHRTVGELIEAGEWPGYPS